MAPLRYIEIRLYIVKQHQHLIEEILEQIREGIEEGHSALDEKVIEEAQYLIREFSEEH